MRKILVSACLLGYPCRYDGKSNLEPKIIELKKKYILIPICPEQFGGLPTPRNKSERKGTKVISESGSDVTAFFLHGAEKTLEIAKKENPLFCILKENSPSCGVHFIHDGNFQGKKISGQGITAECLKKHHYLLYSEQDFLKKN